MASHSALAFQDFSFQPSRSAASTAYYPMASSSSYAPRDQGVSPHDLSSLAQQFGQHSIRHDPRNISSTYSQPAASGPYYHQVPQSHAMSSTHHSQSAHQSSTRSQRQASSRSQCSAGHVQQLSSLSDRMISPAECATCMAEAARPEPALSWEDETLGDEFHDEGFEEPPSLPRITYRRSTDLTASGSAYVSKSIRVRKKPGNEHHRFR